MPPARRVSQEKSNDTLSIASLNVKNLKTNMNFMKHLSRIFPIVFLQETWPYRCQTNIITEIYNNTEFVCGCVVDNEPVPPSLHMRGYGGTSIL